DLLSLLRGVGRRRLTLLLRLSGTRLWRRRRCILRRGVASQCRQQIGIEGAGLGVPLALSFLDGLAGRRCAVAGATAAPFLVNELWPLRFNLLAPLGEIGRNLLTLLLRLSSTRLWRRGLYRRGLCRRRRCRRRRCLLRRRAATQGRQHVGKVHH